MERQGNQACHKSETGEFLCVPNIVLYGADTWTMRKEERKKIDAFVFEMWCWQRVMRVSWMERKTNVWVLENIEPEWTLESRVAQPR